MAAAHPYASHPQSGWDLPSALVVGDTEAAVRGGERTFEAAERPAGRALAAEQWLGLTDGTWRRFGSRLQRRADPHDGRRIFIEMTPATSRSLRHFFAEAGLALV